MRPRQRTLAVALAALLGCCASARPFAAEPSGGFLGLLFHTCHLSLADMQVALFKRAAPGAQLVVVFDCKERDGLLALVPTASWQQLGATVAFVTEQEEAALFNGTNALDPSMRNSKIVHWAFQKHGIPALRAGSPVGLFDGDVLPLTPWDDAFLGGQEDVACRRHPNPNVDYCWIGLIFVSPSALGRSDIATLDFLPGGGLDSGGGTRYFFERSPQLRHGWYTEAIHLEKGLAGGVFDEDLEWIRGHFSISDKCGGEVFSRGGGLFYHMISAASQWRFGGVQANAERIRAVKKHVMGFLEGPVERAYPHEATTKAVPPFGNFTCAQAFG